MRSSPSGALKTRSTRAEKRLVLLAALFIACACAAAYVAGLHADKCKFTAVHYGTAAASLTRPRSIPAAATPLSTTADSQRSTGTLSHAPQGRHILLEYYNIPGYVFASLTDTQRLQHTLTVLIQQSGMTYLAHSCHVFRGTDGLTCVFLLSESHLSLHTWPEHGFAALDIFTCGTSAHPEVMEQGLQELFQPGLAVRQEQARGGLDLSKLSPVQRTAKALHTFVTNAQDGDSLQQQLYQVPVLHSTSSRYQALTVVEVPGQLGRCLLLDGTIQFCSYDLDAYTDHMARHPLQMLQALLGCGPATATADASTGGRSTSAKDNNSADAVLVASAVLPPAASIAVPGHVACRKSLLQPPTHVPSAATAGASNGSTADFQGCLGPQQTKARVLLVGGGDGWIAGHLVNCYSDYVESVTAVELDRTVSEVTERYFGHMMRNGSPFKHPRITWEYTDAYAWAKESAARCSSSARPDSAASNSNSSTAASGTVAKTKPIIPAAAAAAAAARRQLQVGSVANVADTAHTIHASGSSSNHGLHGALDCAGFDVVIIDSTDFTVADASKLHSAPFYAALYQLMKPQAALIQIVEIYMRVFDKDFAVMEATLQGAGWAGVGRSSVFAPSYGGEALMLHAVKR